MKGTTRLRWRTNSSNLVNSTQLAMEVMRKKAEQNEIKDCSFQPVVNYKSEVLVMKRNSQFAEFQLQCANAAADRVVSNNGSVSGLNVNLNKFSLLHDDAYYRKLKKEIVETE